MVQISSKQTAGLGVSVLVCPCKGGGQALGGTLREFCKENTWEAPAGAFAIEIELNFIISNSKGQNNL